MFFTHRTISWDWSPLPGASSKVALCVSSFLANIGWIGPKIYPLLHISEALQNNIIDLFFSF